MRLYWQVQLQEATDLSPILQPNKDINIKTVTFDLYELFVSLSCNWYQTLRIEKEDYHS